MRKFLLGAIALLAIGIVGSWGQQVFPPDTTINCAYNSSPNGYASGSMLRIQCDQFGRLATSTPAGTQNVNITQVASNTLTSTVPTSSLATSSIIGAVSYAAVQSTAGTNATLIASTPGNIYWDDVCNSSTVGLYLKLYDSATAPTVGTSTPVANLLIPAGGCRPTRPGPISFVNGIAYGLSSSKTLMGATPVGVDDISGLMIYKAQ